MTKFILTALFALALFTAQAQTTYTVECPAKDSCFLVEISTAQMINGEPRPSVTINYRFFRTKDEFDGIVSMIKEQANKEISAGVDRSRYMTDVSDKIKAAWPANKK